MNGNNGVLKNKLSLVSATLAVDIKSKRDDCLTLALKTRWCSERIRARDQYRGPNMTANVNSPSM